MTSGFRPSEGPVSDRCLALLVKGVKPKYIIAIVKCTHADDRLLPPTKIIEEMRKIVVVPLG